MDFSSFTPTLEVTDDHSRKLQSEMRVLHRLASTKHLRKELDHPIIDAFLEIKMSRMGGLAYIDVGFLMVYTFAVVFFSVSGERYSADRINQTTYEPTSKSENENITFLEDVFRPLCVQNFAHDPFLFTLFGAIIFVYGLGLAIYKCLRWKKGYTITFVMLCFWYLNLLCIAVRLITNHLCLPSYFFGHAPAVLTSFIFIEELYQLPMFFYSINLFKLVSNKSWKFLAPHCFILFGIILIFYVINLVVFIVNVNDPKALHFSPVSTALTKTFFLVHDAIDIKTRIFAMKTFITLVVLLAIMTLSNMMGLAASKIEKIETKLAQRVLYSQILFVMGSEKLLIFTHNALIRLPCMPSCLINLFRSAVLFSPEYREHSCKVICNASTKITVVTLPNGSQHPLSLKLSDKIMRVDEEDHPENYSPDIVTPDMLENEFTDLEKNIKDRLYRLQSDLQIFISEQNSMLEARVKKLVDKSNLDFETSQNATRPLKNTDHEQLNIWQKQMRVYNSALVENINNSHANLESGFGRFEKTLGEMMTQLDMVLINNSCQSESVHCGASSKDEDDVLNNE